MMAGVSASAEAETGGRLTVDLSSIRANYRLLAKRAGLSECAAVVKADAYGLGDGPVSKTLWTAGARIFFVAHLTEARRVREALPGAMIYVLNGLTPGTASMFADLSARPVLNSVPEIEEWSAFAAANSLSGEAAIHIDTGMNRLGLSLGAAREVAARHTSGQLGFRPALILSHLARADEPDHAMNAVQVEAFRSASELFSGVPASLANSAATLTEPTAAFDVCRPGIALYGGNPLLSSPVPLRPVVHLESRIIQIRDVPAGDSIGYGAAETVVRPTSLAILSIGYADGLLRAAGSSSSAPGASVVIAGYRCPLVGRVSMDLTAADVTDLPPGTARRGSFATVIGNDITVDDVATAAGTISYEILTRLGPRFVRTYRD